MRLGPPFRADHVGSLLRPSELKEARAHLIGDELKTIEDRAILDAIRKQAALGIESATDGEFRRAMWHFDFIEKLGGVESFAAAHGIPFKGGIETKAKGLRVTGKLHYNGHPMIEHFRFSSGIQKLCPR